MTSPEPWKPTHRDRPWYPGKDETDDIADGLEPGWTIEPPKPPPPPPADDEWDPPF